MSQTVAVEALHRALYQRGATVLMVSRSLEAATNLLRYAKVNLPITEPKVRVVKDNETEIVLSNYSRIKSIAASRSAGRTYAASHLYLDEFAFMPWALEIYQAVAPTVSRGGSITVLSTPYGEQNPFALLWRGQLGGDTTWSRHTIPWYLCPDFCPPPWADDPARREQSPWYLHNRPQYTEQQWASEYACDFVLSGNAPFRPEDVDACAIGWTGLQKEPQPGRKYLTAWDIGRRHDATVGITIDVTEPTLQVVAFQRLLAQPYPRIQAAIEARHRHWRGETWVESNGVGDPVIENLAVHVEPFVTTTKSKVNAITALVKAHEQGRFKHAIERLAIETKTYQWDDDDITQDCVMAAAIAVYQASHRPGWLARVERELATAKG
jgi:hypothetical protein